MTQTQIQGAGFRIVKTGLAATVQTGEVFCSIPTDEGQLYRRAMEQLNGQARLTPNQMLVNIREDARFTSYLFYCKKELTLSADIIEFRQLAPILPPPEPKPAPVMPVAPEAAPPPPPPVMAAPPSRGQPSQPPALPPAAGLPRPQPAPAAATPRAQPVPAPAGAPARPQH